MSTGNEHSCTIPYINNVISDIHNHQNNNPPSSGDIYGFIDRAISNSTYMTRYVLSTNGSIYALVIIDRQAALDFNQNYIRQPGINGMEPMFPNDIVDEMREMEGWGRASKDMAAAFILEKYNTGISLLKTTATENFKKLKTIENTDNDGNKTYQPNNCQ